MGPVQDDTGNGNSIGGLLDRVFARICLRADLSGRGVVLLFAAGFFELSFNTMAQTLVQLNAPTDIRGRVVGLFNMASAGMRAFSGITVGLLGSVIGIHWSLGISAAVLLMLLFFLHRLAMKRP